MNSPSDPEQPAEFAFRIVEAAGENVWYVVIIESGAAGTIAGEIANAANEIQAASAVVERVDSPENFEKTIRGATCRVWIGFGFEQFDQAAWSKLDRDRTRLERAPARASGTESSIVVLVMTIQSYGALQSDAPNIASWIGGSVFQVASEGPLSRSARDARLDELRRWGDMTDDQVVRRATEGTLPSDPYYAEWLVLLGRGDLLGNA